jgi:hypothetical protein
MFTPLVATLTVNDPTSALYFDVPGATLDTEPSSTGKSERYVSPVLREALRMLLKAGTDNGVTVRRALETIDEGVRVTFCAVDKITRGGATE